MSLRSMADEPRMIVGAEDGETESVVFCRKCRRIRGKGAGDEDEACVDTGELGVDNTGGTEPARPPPILG